jgi:hypothetical protein
LGSGIASGEWLHSILIGRRGDPPSECDLHENIDMKAKKAFVSLTVLFILLHSCTSGVKENGDLWLQGLVCQFPCWENIIPQKTIYEDVFPILRKEGIEASLASEREISFQTKENIYGSVSKSTAGTVDNMILDVHGQKLRLDDVVQILGSPGKIAFFPHPIDWVHCGVELVFPNHGTLIELYLENNGPESTCAIDVNADSQIFRIMLIGNFDESEFWKHSSYDDWDYVEWKGYGEYP